MIKSDLSDIDRFKIWNFVSRAQSSIIAIKSRCGTDTKKLSATLESMRVTLMGELKKELPYVHQTDPNRLDSFLRRLVR